MNENNNNNNIINNDENVNTEQLFKSTILLAVLSLVSVVADIVGIVVMVAGEGFVGFIIIAIAAFFSWLFITCLKSQIIEASKALKREKEAGKNELKKKYILAGVVGVLSVCFIAVIAGAIYGVNEASYLNYRAEKLIEEAVVNEGVFEELEEFDEYYNSKDAIARLFFSHKAEIEELRAQANNLVVERAKEIEETISKLKPCTKLSSYEEYRERYNELSALTLSEETAYDKNVKANVSNYAELEKHVADLDALIEKYRRVCSGCGGDGRGPRRSCSSCGGSGRHVVTWYSHGDWGEKSYTSYSCNSCNGSGGSSTSCRSCGGSGYIYNFK